MVAPAGAISVGENAEIAGVPQAAVVRAQHRRTNNPTNPKVAHDEPAAASSGPTRNPASSLLMLSRRRESSEQAAVAAHLQTQNSHSKTAHGGAVEHQLSAQDSYTSETQQQQPPQPQQQQPSAPAVRDQASGGIEPTSGSVSTGGGGAVDSGADGVPNHASNGGFAGGLGRGIPAPISNFFMPSQGGGRFSLGSDEVQGADGRASTRGLGRFNLVRTHSARTANSMEEGMEGYSPRKTAMLRNQGKQAREFVQNRVQRVRSSLMTDADGNIHVRDTWKHMKTRSWKRYKTALRWRRTSWRQYWGILYTLAFAVFVAVRAAVFHAADAATFIMIAALLVIAYTLSTQTVGVYSIIVFEFFFAVYLYFLLEPRFSTYSILPESSGITDLLFLTLVITPCVMVLTAVFMHFLPYLVYYTKAYTHLGLRVTSQQYIDMLSMHDQIEQANSASNGAAATNGASAIGTREGSTKQHVDALRSISPSMLRDQFAIAHHGDKEYYSEVILVEMRERRRDLVVFQPEEHVCLYVGPLLYGRPHGLGQWIDSSPLGENLFGYFDAGIPVGPFRSNENSTETRSSFSNLRIVYVDDCHAVNPLVHIEPQWGVASVECCVSGENLLGWPKAGSIKEPVVCGCELSRCVCAGVMLDSFYLHLDDTKRTTSITVSVDESWRGLKVSGHRPSRRSHQRSIHIRLFTDEELDRSAEEQYARSLQQQQKLPHAQEQVITQVQAAAPAVEENVAQQETGAQSLEAAEVAQVEQQAADMRRKANGMAEAAAHTHALAQQAQRVDASVTMLTSQGQDRERVRVSQPNGRQQVVRSGVGSTPGESPSIGTAGQQPHSHALSSMPAGEDVNLLADTRWLPMSDSEAIVYVHGYKHTRVDIVRRFGQFLAMANLPPSIKPFMFHWPSGRGGASYFPAYSSAMSDPVADDFMRFMYSLRNAGIKSVHFMLHSMGARVFFNAWSRCSHLFVKVRELPGAQKLESLDMLSRRRSSRLPTNVVAEEYDKDDMEEQNGDVARRSIETSLDEASDQLFLSNLILLNPDYEIEVFRDEAAALCCYTPRMTLYVDRRDAALKLAQACTSRARLGYLIEPLVDESGAVIDMDIIDTTDLEANIGGSYHSFWNINRSVVDDIHELVTAENRARYRTSRLISMGGAYRFIQTPSHIIEV